jgi:Putative Ig domain
MAGRRWFTLLVGLALAMSGLGAVSAAPAKTLHALAAKATRLTLAVSADEVDHASRVTLSGKLTSNSKGVKRQKLVLKHRAGGSQAWTKIGTVTTTRRGTWKKAVDVRVRGDYMAVFKGTKAYAASKSAKRQVDVFAPLTDLAVSPGLRDAYKDEDWTWTALTAPELVGSSVRLVRGPSKLPTTVATGTVGPGGAIAITYRMSQVGQWEYRVSVDGSVLMYGATSASTLVRTRADGVPTPPSITTDSLPSVEVHLPYQANLVATGGDLTWSVAGGTLPPGLSLSSSGALTGAPAAAGSWSFTVQAANMAGTATRALTFTSTPGTLAVTTYPLDDAAIGQLYPDGSYSSGGFQSLECEPCPQGADWTVTSGALPPGFDIGYDDVVDMTYVYGDPTQAGLYTFTVTGIAGAHSGSKQFSLRVLPGPGDLLRIDRIFESIPNGTLGQPYSHQFTAAGAPGVAWSALGSLPPGLTLSSGGLLSGTPTLAGSGWIAVAATDGTRYDWQAFQFMVRPSP